MLPLIIPLRTKSEPPPKSSLSCISITLSPIAEKSHTSVGMAKVNLRFVGKQDQSPISHAGSADESVQVVPCCPITLSENLTGVRPVRANRTFCPNLLQTVCGWIPCCLPCCSPGACYEDAAQWYTDHLQQFSYIAYHFVDVSGRFTWPRIVSTNDISFFECNQRAGVQHLRRTCI